MNKAILISLLLAIGFISCKNSKKEINRVDIVKQYFNSLNSSDLSRISNQFSDSLKTIEGKHKNIYFNNDYLEILKWDSVFQPRYKILEIKEYKNGNVEAKISKMDRRITFLHEKSFLTNQIFSFQKDKITSIETDYLNFDYTTWGENKNALLDWIEKNHPELNGFVNDMTKNGGVKFLKAIELYNSKDKIEI